jgi:hypothetical protein
MGHETIGRKKRFDEVHHDPSKEECLMSGELRHMLKNIVILNDLGYSPATAGR